MQKRQLYNKETSEKFVPVTHFGAVYDDAGNTLTQWRGNVETAITALQNDVNNDIKPNKENRFVRLGGIVNNVTYSSSSPTYDMAYNYQVVYDKGNKVVLLQVTALGSSPSYYSNWSNIRNIRDRSVIELEGDFFYLTDSEGLTVYHWHGVSGLVPTKMDLSEITTAISTLQGNVSDITEEMQGEPTVVEITEDDLDNETYTYWTNSKGTASRGVYPISVVGYDDFEVTVDVAANSPIKAAIQLRSTAGEYQNPVFDSGWKINGSTVTAAKSNVPAGSTCVELAIISTYIDAGTGIPTLAELQQYLTIDVVLINRGSQGLVSRIEEIADDVESLESEVNALKPLSTQHNYLGEKIDLTEHSFNFEQMGEFSRPASFNPGSGTVYAFTQGGAAYGQYFYQFYTHNKYVKVWDMATNELLQTISRTAEQDNHCGSGGFGNVKHTSTDAFPLLYISDMENKAVNVYRLTGSLGSQSMTKVQTITLDTDAYVTNIAVDNENNRFVVFGYTQNTWSDPTNNLSVIGVAQIPTYVENGTAEVNVTDTFNLPYIYAQQGAFARGGKLYLAWGSLADSNAYGAGILVIDVSRQGIASSVPLDDITDEHTTAGGVEPEALVWYDGAMWMTTQYSGPSGSKTAKIYKLNF